MARIKLIVLLITITTFLPRMMLAINIKSDSISTQINKPWIVKSVKVEYKSKSFWLIYDSIDDIVTLTKSGFKIIKTSKKIIKQNKGQSFWQKLLHDTTRLSVETGIKWVQTKLLKIPPD